MSVLINIFGPSTAGKSTITDLLQKNIPNLKIVDFDPIKRQIPNYDWKKHGQAGRDMTLIKLTSAIKTGAPVLLLYPPTKDNDEYNRIESTAKTNDYTVNNIEITAPDDILVERYKHRLATIEPAKRHWKFKTLDEFKAKLQENYFKPADTVSFDSSQLSPDEILQHIISYLGQTDFHRSI